MPRIEFEIKLGYEDVLFRPKRSTLASRSDVTLEREIRFRNSGLKYRGVPVMASNMDTTGTFDMARAFSASQMFVCIHKHYTVQQWVEFAANNPQSIEHVAVSAGSSQRDLDKLKDIISQVPVNFICLDVANGYSEHFVAFVKKVRESYPSKTIIAGNVVTGEMVEELILAGADLVKVGIGPGSVCTTRKKTGVGYPQLSAVLECADAAHGLGGHIVADGGCTCPGDVAKAFGAGADFVMLGGMFAGHDEGSGEIIEKDGQKFVKFYGMSSATAMEKHSGGVASYRTSEGKTVLIPYKGSIEVTIQDILGGVRSCCTYVGAVKLKELPKRTTFVRVTKQINEIYGKQSINKTD